ncbi:hypothetical protein [Streptomyces sp. NBC_01320]|uniref:hypothetical protein n=1 Tax=Streptomyces sp. NBC_01320 TaxID=2903824 RepID=UPI002E12FC10|nr:hypothetical protein OG395_03095 [Streptomyces sp. NBC_01320]
MTVSDHKKLLLVERVTNEQLLAFITGQLDALGPRSAATENLVLGVRRLMALWEEILPHLEDAGPDYATGVADGLGQGLRHIATAWDHHPDYQSRFHPQAPALASEWPQ